MVSDEVSLGLTPGDGPGAARGEVAQAAVSAAVITVTITSRGIRGILDSSKGSRFLMVAGYGASFRPLRPLADKRIAVRCVPCLARLAGIDLSPRFRSLQ